MVPCQPWAQSHSSLQHHAGGMQWQDWSSPQPQGCAGVSTLGLGPGDTQWPWGRHLGPLWEPLSVNLPRGSILIHHFQPGVVGHAWKPASAGRRGGAAVPCTSHHESPQSSPPGGPGAHTDPVAPAARPRAQHPLPAHPANLPQEKPNLELAGDTLCPQPKPQLWSVLGRGGRAGGEPPTSPIKGFLHRLGVHAAVCAPSEHRRSDHLTLLGSGVTSM